MVEIVWTKPAIADLEAVADFIALEDLCAASALVQRIFVHVRQLQVHPESGSRPGSTLRLERILALSSLARHRSLVAGS